ncbi:MAG TPA: DUF3501 family protein [Anaeromyxobacteraceae bacterium]|nr:DUF3501 family protein [Anaeromyxobacteraceae bacterium]
MRTVARQELLDLGDYERARPEIRGRVMATKAPRRVHLGEVLTFLFENAETVRYQIQEMIRAERIVDEAAILHELETYNELLGGRGELGCALLIEIDDPATRDAKLREWLSLPEHLYLATAAGKRVRATYDRRQVGADRLSSVQYLKFDVEGQVPVAVGCDLPGLRLEVPLSPEQRAALEEDLRADDGATHPA